MNRVKLFTLPSCPKCPAAKHLAEQLTEGHGIPVETYDMSTAAGLAEGASYGVMGTPTFLVVADPEGEDRVVGQWPGTLPSLKELAEAADRP